MIEKELGRPVHELFDGLTKDTQPVAAASLGQVYKCKTKGGEWVAVKVQRPDMLQRVALDQYLLRQIFQAIEVLKGMATKQRPHDVAIFDAFATGSYLELDYLNEARNQERFINELLPKNNMRESIYIPAVYWSTTSRKVLTSEWCDGEKLASSPIDVINRLVPVGVQCFLTQLLDLGFFHCDPHPGNLLVSPEGKLVLLDFGLCSEIDQPSSKSMTKAIVHLMSGDFQALVAEDAVALGFLPEDADTARILPPVRAILQKGIVEPGSNLLKRKEHFKTISNDLNEVFFEHPFSVPDYFALVTRALGVLEGIALTGDPDFDIFAAAQPYAKSHALKIFGAQELGVIAEEAFKTQAFKGRGNGGMMGQMTNVLGF
jgi:aarF domain-containing kinase